MEFIKTELLPNLTTCIGDDYHIIIGYVENESMATCIASDKYDASKVVEMIFDENDDLEDFVIKFAHEVLGDMTMGELCEKYDSHIQDYGEVGEPGYHYDAILTGDWWIRNEGELADVTDTLPFRSSLRRAFPDCEKVLITWDDEWYPCSCCGKYYRTEPDCYSWKSSLHIGECDATCESCLREYPEELLAEFTNDPTKALIFDWDLEELGWVKYNGTYENGLHRGMNDDPMAITEHLNMLGFNNVLFKIPTVSQFYITFESWVPREDVSEWNADGSPRSGKF
jgi:hypothetical protein